MESLPPEGKPAERRPNKTAKRLMGAGSQPMNGSRNESPYRETRQRIIKTSNNKSPASKNMSTRRFTDQHIKERIKKPSNGIICDIING
jgi:hypothetical protein